jgi:adenine-specific DNA-methyltransferase
MIVKSGQILVKSSESIGIITEMMLCKAFNIEFNTKRSNYSVIDEVSQDVCHSLRDYFGKKLILKEHVGHKNEYYDFLTSAGKTVSVKTNITGNKVCPQNIGQVSLKRFKEKTNFSQVNSCQDFKDLVMSHTQELLGIYLKNLFCCDTTLHFQYNSGKTTAYEKTEEISLIPGLEYKFTKTAETWNESNTMSIKVGEKFKSLVEFQVHNKRDCLKARFNSDTIELMVKSGILNGINLEVFELSKKYDIKVSKTPKPDTTGFFKSFNYIGSKFRLLDFIIDSIQDYAGQSITELGSFGDFFSGTGVVSQRLLEEGASKVVSADVQYYSYLISSVFTDNEVNVSKVKAIITRLNSITIDSSKDTDFVYNNYTLGGSERVYLSPENGLKVDRIRKEIGLLSGNGITQMEYNLLLKTLLYATSKVSNVASVYGAYLKKLKKSAQTPLVLQSSFVDNLLPSANKKHVSYCRDINESCLFSEDVQVVYLDPPYNQRNYSTNYHLLETIARQDFPEIKGKTGLRAENNPEPKSFCSKKNIYSAFENTVSSIKSKYLFISYSSEGILTKDQMLEILGKTRTNVICKEIEYSKFKSSEAKSNTCVMEYLFCAELI